MLLWMIAECCAEGRRTLSMRFLYFQHFTYINSFNPRRLYEVGALITSNFTERAEDRENVVNSMYKKKKVLVITGQ